MALPPINGIVALLSDFGPADPYVGIMKGAVLRAFPRAILVDVCHDIPPFDVVTAAFFVGAAIGRFPDGTVHVAVVDPGVGTERRPIAIAAAGAYWVGPDNGVLSPVLALDGAEVRSIDIGALGIGPESRTFHGRDVFAPVAGLLARGRYGFGALGPRIADPVRAASADEPRVVFCDRFGNLVTNLPGEGSSWSGIRIAGRVAPRCGTYGERSPGTLVALVNSFGTAEVAVVEGSAHATLGVGRGAPVEFVCPTGGAS